MLNDYAQGHLLSFNDKEYLYQTFKSNYDDKGKLASTVPEN